MRMDPDIARIDARNVLRQAAEDDDRFTRAKTLEAMVAVMPKESGPHFLEALTDPEPNVRFAAAVAVAETKYAAAKDQLLKLARYKADDAEPDRRVYAGVIYALYRLGNTDYTTDLAKLLFDKESQVRGNAAMVMGRMGEPSGIGPLKALLVEERDVAVRLQGLESLAMLGDERSIMMLEASARKPFPAEKLVAIRSLGWFKSRRAIFVLQELLKSESQPPRARVLAAGSLARIGEFEEHGYELCLTSAREPRQVMIAATGETYKPLDADVISLQRLAVISLGHMGRPAAIDVIHPLLRDSDGGVRVAAAMSILQLLAEIYPEPEKSVRAEPAPAGKAPQADSEIKLYTGGWKQ